MLQKKSCTESVDKKSLCQAFKTLQSALLGSDDKKLAEAVLKKINGVPFLREGWERYKKQEGKATPTDQQLDSTDNFKNVLKGMGINM